jgi:hypothetical protein
LEGTSALNDTLILRFNFYLQYSSFQTQGGLSIWEMIHKYKHPILEPRESSMLGVAMTEYYACIKNGLDQLSKSAVFFAVCRGKVSEGLDFADANGRAVVIVGLPFPQAKDPKINLKKEYMDLMKRTRQQTPGAPQVRLCQYYTRLPLPS